MSNNINTRKNKSVFIYNKKCERGIYNSGYPGWTEIINVLEHPRTCRAPRSRFATPTEYNIIIIIIIMKYSKNERKKKTDLPPIFHCRSRNPLDQLLLIIHLTLESNHSSGDLPHSAKGPRKRRTQRMHRRVIIDNME